jgi:hypothetical protein
MTTLVTLLAVDYVANNWFLGGFKQNPRKKSPAPLRFGSRRSHVRIVSPRLESPVFPFGKAGLFSCGGPEKGAQKRGPRKGTGVDPIEFSPSAYLVIGSSTKVQVEQQSMRSKTHHRMDDLAERSVVHTQKRPPSPFLSPASICWWLYPFFAAYALLRKYPSFISD